MLWRATSISCVPIGGSSIILKNNFDWYRITVRIPPAGGLQSVIKIKALCGPALWAVFIRMLEKVLPLGNATQEY
jgi:hypothetical protein